MRLSPSKTASPPASRRAFAPLLLGRADAPRVRDRRARMPALPGAHAHHRPDPSPYGHPGHPRVPRPAHPGAPRRPRANRRLTPDSRTGCLASRHPRVSHHGRHAKGVSQQTARAANAQCQSCQCPVPPAQTLRRGSSPTPDSCPALTLYIDDRSIDPLNLLCADHAGERPRHHIEKRSHRVEQDHAGPASDLLEGAAEGRPIRISTRIS